MTKYRSLSPSSRTRTTLRSRRRSLSPLSSKRSTFSRSLSPLSRNRTKKSKSKFSITRKSRSKRVQMLQRHPNLNIKYPDLLNRKTYNSIEKISKQDSTLSGSDVYKVFNKKGSGFVLKLTHVDKDIFYNDNSLPATEIKMYKTMNALVTNNVTPHVFTIMDSIKVKRADSTLGGKIPKDKYGTYAMFVESNLKEDNITTLADLIFVFLSTEPPADETQKKQKHSILNLLFQIIYTIKAFNMIGLKHNDLHLGNILILLNTPSDKVTHNKYVLTDDTEVILDNIDISARIFDFDRSCKNPVKSIIKKEFRNAIKPDEIYHKGRDYYSCNANNRADIYRVLYNIWTIGKKTNTYITTILKHLLTTIFRGKLSLLESGKYTYLIHAKKIPSGILTTKSSVPTNDEMMSIDEILKLIADEIKGTENSDGTLSETYELNNILSE